VEDSAIIETPGFEQTFGTLDRVAKAAPGGRIRLESRAGALIAEAGTILSVGAVVEPAKAQSEWMRQGNAGTLELIAPRGQSLNAIAATLDGRGNAALDGSGGSLTVDLGSNFDFVAYATRLAEFGFTGDLSITTRSGDLALNQKDTLTARSVRLAAENGEVRIYGIIDTAGTSGGDIALFGRKGVTLHDTAQLIAAARGYGYDSRSETWTNTDSRVARAGDVTLGTEDTGHLEVRSGALIDLRALQTEDRIAKGFTANRVVPVLVGGQEFYLNAEADQGGTLTLRAPVFGNSASGYTINVNVASASSVRGASNIFLEGFRRFDLAAIAVADANLASSAIKSVTIEGNTARIDPRGRFFADATFGGGMAEFVQNYRISDATLRALGGLASRPGFRERPGVDLAYEGNVEVTRNWNLGAGTVDVAAAKAAGLIRAGFELDFDNFTFDPVTFATIPAFRQSADPAREYVAVELEDLTSTARGQLAADFGFGDDLSRLSELTPLQIKDWVQSSLFTRYTSLLYRTKRYRTADGTLIERQTAGSPFGEAPNFSIRAGGNLTVRGSISDGFFSFREQTSPQYFAALQEDSPNIPLALDDFFQPLGVDYNFNLANPRSPYLIPYSADANAVSPNDWGNTTATNVYRAGDPFGGMELMPRLIGAPSSQGDAARTVAAKSASLKFLAGADVARKAGQLVSGVAPSATLPGVASLNVRGTYTFDTNGVFRPSPQDFSSAGRVITPVAPVIRTGAGDLELGASGSVDLSAGNLNVAMFASGTLLQVGGARVYTAGVRADVAPFEATSPDGLRRLRFDPTSVLPTETNLSFERVFLYYFGAYANQPESQAIPAIINGALIADPVFAESGGDVTLKAGDGILTRRDFAASTALSQLSFSTGVGQPSDYRLAREFIGEGTQSWRVGRVGFDAVARVNPQQFFETVGTLAGGNITVSAGQSITDLSAIATASLVTGETRLPNGLTTRALFTFGGGGNVALTAGADILGGRVDVASGEARLTALRDIGAATRLPSDVPRDAVRPDASNLMQIRLANATADVRSGRASALGGIAGLGVSGNATRYTSETSSKIYELFNSIDRDDRLIGEYSFYTPIAGLRILANAEASIANTLLTPDVIDTTSSGQPNSFLGIYPGSLSVVSLTGNVTLRQPRRVSGAVFNDFVPGRIVQAPSPFGQLELLAAAGIAPFTLSMEDSDPATLRGLFSRNTESLSFVAQSDPNRRPWSFPNTSPDASEAARRLQHASSPTHLNNPNPVRIYAGLDLTNVTLSLPKQARIEAGRDILNMVFFGQNLATSDITSIIAGRDITATTSARALADRSDSTASGTFFFGSPRPAVAGNTFALGGPGQFILQAGRNAGPFLTSALPAPYGTRSGLQARVVSTITSENPYAGGILAVGNEMNPFLPRKSADISVRFGTGRGIAWDRFREAYLNPSNWAALSDDLFKPANSGQGPTVPRGAFVYESQVIAWVNANAKDEVSAAGLSADNLNYAQAYDILIRLPILRQQLLLQEIYFQELIATASPENPSFQRFSRGYQAINALFPAELGYTRNALDGGDNTGTTPIPTGDFDLRLSTIQTAQTGNIRILGPGGRVLGGSVVRTSDQILRRNFAGIPLYAGSAIPAPVTEIRAIPSGFEGVITVDGGSLYGFTDGDFLLNQSRAFTIAGGDIALWSSNADLNAGEGPRATSNFPAVAIRCDLNGDCEEDRAGATSGAGIATFQTEAGVSPGNVFLIAPRGTVDAGAAGVRSAGNISVAALRVLNADQFQATGSTIGIPQVALPNVSGSLSGSQAAAAAQQSDGPEQEAREQPSIIIVEVLGYGGGDGPDEPCPEGQRRGLDGQCVSQQPVGQQSGYDWRSPLQVTSFGPQSR
jgi:hypothetical protein